MKPPIRVQYFIASIVLLIILVAGCYFVIRSWPVRVVKFKGSYEHVSEAEIQKHLVDVIPHSMFSLDLIDFKGVVKKLPWIKEASIRRLWPDTLLIYFQEYIPYATWCHQGILASDGKMISAKESSSVLSGLNLQLCGPEGTEQVVLQQYKHFQNLLDKVDLKVKTVYLSERYAWELAVSEHLIIKVGRQAVDMRLKNFVDHWDALKHSIPTAAIIDLRYPNGIAVRSFEFMAENKL